MILLGQEMHSCSRLSGIAQIRRMEGSYELAKTLESQALGYAAHARLKTWLGNHHAFVVPTAVTAMRSLACKALG